MAEMRPRGSTREPEKAFYGSTRGTLVVYQVVSAKPRRRGEW
jgi:hypothetical protein